MRRKYGDPLQVSPSEESDPSKKPRRSERISSLGQRRYEDPAKTPVISNRQHLPSPLTNQGLTSEETSEPAHDKEATATPPVAGGHQLRAATEDPPASYVHSQGFSSPPEDTQAFPSQYAEARNAALSEEVQDEVKEGVWGYLFPLDTRYGRCIVLRKRDACALPDRVNDGSTFRRSGRRGGEAEYERPKTEGLPSGGYLIGRHPECGM